MKKVKLGEIAKLNVGLVLSRYGEKSKELGHARNGLADKAIYKSVTLRAISDDGVLNISECDTFEVTEKIPFQYFTQKDDILMRLFSPIKVGLVAKEQENLIVPSQFAIIRIDSEQILVEYLFVLMQQPYFCNQIERVSKGSQLKTLSVSSLADMELSIPDIQIQKKIIDFLHIVNNDVYSSFKCLEKHFSGWLHATFISISKAPQLFNNALLKSLSHQVSLGVSDFPILDRRVLPIYQNIFFFPDINKLHQTTKKVGHHS